MTQQMNECSYLDSGSWDPLDPGFGIHWIQDSASMDEQLAYALAIDFENII